MGRRWRQRGGRRQVSQGGIRSACWWLEVTEEPPGLTWAGHPEVTWYRSTWSCVTAVWGFPSHDVMWAPRSPWQAGMADQLTSHRWQHWGGRTHQGHTAVTGQRGPGASFLTQAQPLHEGGQLMCNENSDILFNSITVLTWLHLLGKKKRCILLHWEMTC